jgi:hypothetical protein
MHAAYRTQEHIPCQQRYQPGAPPPRTRQAGMTAMERDERTSSPGRCRTSHLSRARKWRVVPGRFHAWATHAGTGDHRSERSVSTGSAPIARTSNTLHTGRFGITYPFHRNGHLHRPSPTPLPCRSRADTIVHGANIPVIFYPHAERGLVQAVQREHPWSRSLAHHDGERTRA